MLDRNDSPLELPAGSAHRLGNASPSTGASAPDSRIEDYLDHVCAPLVGLVPYARRLELRAELRGHLAAQVATHEELGSKRDAAVVLALRQFGPPQRLARQWAREWTHGAAPASLQPAWRAMLVALGSFGAAALLALALLAVLTLSPASYFGEIVPFVILGVVGIALPAMAGLITGHLAPARQALGAFYAQAILILPSVALTILSLRQPAGRATLADCGVMLALAQSFCWVPIGCGAAALGGWLQRCLALRPRQWVLQ